MSDTIREFASQLATLRLRGFGCDSALLKTSITPRDIATGLIILRTLPRFATMEETFALLNESKLKYSIEKWIAKNGAQSAAKKLLCIEETRK